MRIIFSYIRSLVYRAGFLLPRTGGVWALVIPMFFVAGAGSFTEFENDKIEGNQSGNNLRVEVVQHIEANRHTLHRPLTTRGSRPVELNEYGVAAVRVTGMPGEKVRILLETSQKMKSERLYRQGGDLNFQLQAGWLEGDEIYSSNGWSRARKVADVHEFTIQLSSHGGAERTVHTLHDREVHAQKSRQGRILKEIEDVPYDAHQNVRRHSQAGGTATIYVKPVLMPDGRQLPGRYRTDITIRAEYETDGIHFPETKNHF